MPKIYEYIGFVFFFYSNEHLPIHCHVKKGQKEIKAEILFEDGIPVVKFRKIRGKIQITGDALDTVEDFIIEHHKQIVNKWTTYFVYGQSPEFEKIKSK